MDQNKKAPLHTNVKLGVHNYKIMYRKNFWFVNHCRYFFSFGEGRDLSEQVKITPGECHSPRLRVIKIYFPTLRWLLNWFLFQVKKLKKGGRAVAYSPDGSSVAVGQNDGGFLILDSESLEKIVGFKDRKESISDIKFSPGNSCVSTDCLFFPKGSLRHESSLVRVASFENFKACAQRKEMLQLGLLTIMTLRKCSSCAMIT